MFDKESTDVFEEFEVFSDKLKKCIKYLSEPYIEGMGLRSHQVVFLFAIEKNGGISQKMLKEHVPYDKSRISMVVTELTNLGMIRNSSSGKTSSLTLTDKGIETCRKIRAIIEEFNTRILGSFSDEELDLFLGGLGKIERELDSIITAHGGNRSD